MLIFAVTTALLVIAVVIFLCSNKYTEPHSNAGVAASLLCVFMLASVIYLCISRAMPGLQKEEIEAEREIIVYQMENQKDFLQQSRIGVDELLYTQIKEFNDKVRLKQYCRRSPWLSWFVPPFWDEIELIDYNVSG